MRHPLALALLAASPALSAASEVVWNNPWNSTASQIGPSSDSTDSWGEVADDFDVVAAIDRLIAYGDGAGCFSCDPPATQGVFVRFYQWTDAGPGPLQREYFLAAGDPGFRFDPRYPQQVDIRLPDPFNASGRHFVSIQLVFGDTPNTWDMWTLWPSNMGAPTLSPARRRNAPGSAWTTPQNSDIAFALFGDRPGGPTPSSDPCGEWDLDPTPELAGSFYSKLGDIAVVWPDDAWAVGAAGVYSGQWPTQRTLALHWDGAAWNPVPTPTPADCPDCAHAGFGAVAVVAPDDVWAAGNAQLRNGHLALGTHIMVQRWDGDSWRLVPTPDLGGGSGDSLADIEVLAPDQIWFVGTDQPQPIAPQPALALRWNGSGFERFPVPIVNPEHGRDSGNPLNAIDALAPDDMWAVGGTEVTAEGAHDYSQIHHWNGSEWVHVPGPTPGFFNQLFAVEMIATDDVWAAGEYWDVDGIFPFLIHWDGASWTQVPAPDIFFDLHAFGPDDIYASSGGIYHYDGDAWTRVDAIPEALFPRLAALDALDRCQLWAAGLQESDDLRSLIVRQVPGAACAADFDGDGQATVADFTAFRAAFLAGEPRCDYSGNGALDIADFTAFRAAFLAGCG